MSTSLIFFACGAITLLYVVYRWSLPRPIPGIPYNKESSKSILGDLPGLLEHERKTGEKLSWFPLQAKRLNSPIAQVFTVPSAKPWIILTDFRESQDIMLRRTKEFDRSDQFGTIFRGLTPDHHISMKSTNPEFKAHRKLIQDLMTPAFLNEVSAPRIYEAFTSLFDLWAKKATLAEGHPFSALDDFYKAALDAIWVVTFPLDPKDSVINAERRLLTGVMSVTAWSNDIDKPVTFPETPMPDAQNAILTLTESLEKVMLSPIPRITSWFLSQMPYMRKARAAKENMIATELTKAQIRLTGGREEDQVARCAMDDILRRELVAAKRENREPVYNTRAIYDELFGLLVAGHDTTSTTVTWGLKLLSDHQEVQQKLREALRTGFATAIAERRRPTAQEIAKAHIPYLDATQEEIIRKSLTASTVTRTAMQDTHILGHHVPKGTNIFFMGNGPDFIEPPICEIPDERRSDSYKTASLRTGSWDSADCHLFKPERWLTTDDNGKEVFDSTAGPLLTFGLGPRGCFGKRMAYLEMKIVLVLLIWNFELKSVPASLNSYQAVDKLTHQPRQCYLRLLNSPLHDLGA